MKRVYSAADSLAVDQRHDQLERAGIASVVRNRDLAGLQGALPATECWVELWVLDDADAAEAEALLAAAPASSATPASWRCRRCGEPLEGTFDTCWHCGAPRIEALTPARRFDPVVENPPPAPRASERLIRHLQFWLALVAMAIAAWWMLNRFTRPWEG